MKINGISKEQADKLQIGQSLKIKSQPTLQPKNYPTSSTAIFPRTVWPNTSPTGKTPIPYKDIAAEQQYLRDNAKAIQEQLIEAKFNVGKWGADGIWGKASQTALEEAKANGYRLVKGKLVKPESPKAALAKVPELVSKVAKVTPKQKAPETQQNLGSAFYISYPEHRISTKGTGFEDVFGQYIPGIRGHAASIILDANGNATYHTYGRYDSDNGTYRSKQLPARRQGESEEAYLKRIRPHLEYYDNREPVKATYITDVNAQQSREYYSQQPQKGNYGFVTGSTCVGEACAGINAGRSINVGEALQRGIVPDTPGAPHIVNFGTYPSYEV
jgi:hypothetical protein